MTDLAARADLTLRILQCTACELAQCGPAVPFSAPLGYDGRIAIVAEAPGSTEVKRGEPLVGPAGQELRRQLTEAGIDPTSVAMLNAVSHLPSIRKTSTPLPADISACRPLVEAQLAFLAPRYILVLGRVALESWWVKGLAITAARGHWWEARYGDDTAHALATFHPSAVLRDRSLRPIVIEDLTEFAHYAQTASTPPRTPWCIPCLKSGRGTVPERYIRGLGVCRSHSVTPREESGAFV